MHDVVGTFFFGLQLHLAVEDFHDDSHDKEKAHAAEGSGNSGRNGGWVPVTLSHSKDGVELEPEGVLEFLEEVVPSLIQALLIVILFEVEDDDS
jgi:hypothetical protein